MSGETVTVHRKASSGTDPYGNPTYTETTTTVDGAAFNPGGSSEPVEAGRAPVVTEPTLLFRGQWPDIRVDDRVTVRGETFTVEGKPADWRSPHGTGRGGLVVTLKRSEG